MHFQKADQQRSRGENDTLVSQGYHTIRFRTSGGGGGSTYPMIKQVKIGGCSGHAGGAVFEVEGENLLKLVRDCSYIG